MSKKTILRDTARGQQCMIRVPNVCNHDPETTVLAHLNGGGMGKKKHDSQAAFACFACHAAVDHRVPSGWNRETLELWHRQGVELTQEWWFDNGYLEVVGK